MASVPFPFFLAFAFVLGAAIGSFGNVLLIRLARHESVGGRSRCPSCRKQLTWYELVPLLSFLLLRGRCRRCRKPIALQYFIMEAGCALLFVCAALLSPHDPLTALSTAVVFVGLLLACIFDYRHQQIPDAFTAIVLCGALLSAFLRHSLQSGLAGALLCLLWFGGQWMVSRGKYVGSGDIFLSMSLAVWLGFTGTVAMLLLSYVLGMFVAVYLLLARRVKLKGSRLAFAPFLAAGALLSFLGVGDIYLHLL